MTGFDVPSCSTIYMDNLLRNHTLMQTIARANRVFPDKECGTIVDYVGVFRNLNRSRIDYLEKFQQMIDQYNAGSVNVEAFLQKLVEFTQELNHEEQRAVREELTDEELAMFDLLTKPEIRLTRKQEIEVKKIARQLLDKLKSELLVLSTRPGVSCQSRWHPHE